MKKLLYFFCLLITTQFVSQTDNLEPENGFFARSFEDEYFSSIEKILFNGLNAPEARLIVIPSFSPEFLISVEKSNNKYFLIYRIAKQQIWETQNKESVKYTESRMEITKSFSVKVHELVFLAISKTRYSNLPKGGLDGINYYFSAFEIGYGMRSAKAWSPHSGNVFELLEVFDWLLNCVKKGEILEKEKMMLKIDALTEKFKKD